MNATVRDNISIANLLGTCGPGSSVSARSPPTASGMRQALRIKTPASCKSQNLSGGTNKKSLISRWLLTSGDS